MSPTAPQPLISRSQILSMWTDQNPDLVHGMKADGRLERRLKESLADALAVAGSALNRGLHISQALELARDAVSLPWTPDDEDETD